MESYAFIKDPAALNAHSSIIRTNYMHTCPRTRFRPVHTLSIRAVSPFEGPNANSAFIIFRSLARTRPFVLYTQERYQRPHEAIFHTK